MKRTWTSFVNVGVDRDPHNVLISSWIKARVSKKEQTKQISSGLVWQIAFNYPRGKFSMFIVESFLRHTKQKSMIPISIVHGRHFKNSSKWFPISNPKTAIKQQILHLSDNCLGVSFTAVEITLLLAWRRRHVVLAGQLACWITNCWSF